MERERDRLSESEMDGTWVLRGAREAKWGVIFFFFFLRF
jgi:hypothetical protein